MQAHALAGIYMGALHLITNILSLGWWWEGLCLQLVVFQVNREKEFSEEQMVWNEE